MKYKWLNKKKHNDIIIFFNGWGMDENIIQHIDYEHYDIIMFYDYNSLDTDFDFKILEKYNNKYLIAWSMGVMIATLFDIKPTKSIAINGTLKPIDDKFGIPKRIYDLTIKNLSPDGVQKFINNMFITTNDKYVNNREFLNQKNELISIKSYTANQNFKYDKIIISTQDKIIPTKNQMNFWGIEPNFHSGHCIFYNIKSWREIL